MVPSDSQLVIHCDSYPSGLSLVSATGASKLTAAPERRELAFPLEPYGVRYTVNVKAD